MTHRTSPHQGLSNTACSLHKACTVWKAALLYPWRLVFCVFGLSIPSVDTLRQFVRIGHKASFADLCNCSFGSCPYIVLKTKGLNPSTNRSRKRNRRSGLPLRAWRISRRPRQVCLRSFLPYSEPFSFSRTRSGSMSERSNRPATSCRSAIHGRTTTPSGWRTRRTNNCS